MAMCKNTVLFQSPATKCTGRKKRKIIQILFKSLLNLNANEMDPDANFLDREMDPEICRILFKSVNAWK